MTIHDAELTSYKVQKSALGIDILTVQWTATAPATMAAIMDSPTALGDVARIAGQAFDADIDYHGWQVRARVTITVAPGPEDCPPVVTVRAKVGGGGGDMRSSVDVLYGEVGSLTIDPVQGTLDLPDSDGENNA